MDLSPHVDLLLGLIPRCHHDRPAGPLDQGVDRLLKEAGSVVGTGMPSQRQVHNTREPQLLGPLEHERNPVHHRGIVKRGLHHDQVRLRGHPHIARRGGASVPGGYPGHMGAMAHGVGAFCVACGDLGLELGLRVNPTVIEVVTEGASVGGKCLIPQEQDP